MIMQNLNSHNRQTQEVSAEILEKILEGKSPDIQSFLINGMSDLLNRAFTSERSLYLSENGSDNTTVQLRTLQAEQVGNFKFFLYVITFDEVAQVLGSLEKREAKNLR